MGRLDKYKGFVKFIFDEVEHKIFLKTDDVARLAEMTDVYRKTKKFDVKALEGIYTDILKRSYPEEVTEENIKLFLDVHLMGFHTEVSIAAGVTTREKIKKLEEKAAGDFLGAPAK